MQIDIDGLLNLPNVQVTDFSFTDKQVSVALSRTTKSEKCPLCQQSSNTVRSYTPRKVRDLDILGRKTFLTLECRQFECSACHRYFIEDIDFIEGNRGFTKRYEEYIYKMSTDTTIQQVSLKQDICWATVNRIHEQYSQQQLKVCEDGWRLVKVLSIDEIAVRKGKRNFACVLRDAERNTVLDFLEKRDMATLKAYFTQKGASICQQVEVVVSDMWDGYVNLVGDKGVFHNAINVIDRFHFVQHLSTALDDQRKLARQEFAQDERLKNLRWPLLKSPDSLNPTEQLQVKAAFEVSPVLGSIYALRTKLKAIFDTDYSKEAGLLALTGWEEDASKLDSKPLARFLVTVKNWKDKVCNFFTDRLTNAGMEGTNNHIRSIIRRAFGYVDFQALRLRVLTECGSAP
jgi:transposase